MILDYMTIVNKKMVSKPEVLTLLEKENPEIFLTMGAGDIDLMVDQITKILLS